jgi:hypothetical protein
VHAQVKSKCRALAAIGIIVPTNKVETLIANIVVSCAPQVPAPKLDCTYNGTRAGTGAMYHTTISSPRSHIAPYEYNSLGDLEGEYEDEAPTTYLADMTIVTYETNTCPASLVHLRLDSGAMCHFWQRCEDLDKYQMLATPILITGVFNSMGYAIGEGTLH